MSPGWERGRVSRAMSTLWDSSEGPSCIGEKSLLIDFLSRVRFAQFDGRTRSVFCESTFFGRFRPCRFAGSAERTLPQRKLNDSSNTQHRGPKKMQTNDQKPAMADPRHVPPRPESQRGGQT